jgi:hypothetical protein
MLFCDAHHLDPNFVLRGLNEISNADPTRPGQFYLNQTECKKYEFVSPKLLRALLEQGFFILHEKRRWWLLFLKLEILHEFNSLVLLCTVRRR